MSEYNIKRDWIGSTFSIFKCIGASNHSNKERETNDYYATDPYAMELLLEQETFSSVVWECACGEGHLSKVLVAYGYNVISTDIVYRGYGYPEPVDFLKYSNDNKFDGDIITNPPYKYALEFAEKGLELLKSGHKLALFLKLTFLEGKKRKQFFLENPPKTIYVSSSRIICAMNGEFEKYPSSAIAYGWFVWEKGYKENPCIKWIN